VTAVAGFWSFDGRFDAAEHCDRIISALAEYGGISVQADASGFSLAARGCSFLSAGAGGTRILSGGEGRFSLVADARLDNRDELGEALRLGVRQLEGLSDPDLLLLALERWGESAPSRLLGDFAFAFYDAHQRRLLLARDPLGNRPLFFHRGPGLVAFASMPAGLLALDMWQRRADEATMLDYLAGLPRSGSNSFHAGIERVEPGHVATLSPNGASQVRYWRPTRRELRLTRFEDYVERYRAELDAAVERRLRGAGDLVAAQLSAGWDSSAVAGTAARLLAPRGGRVLALTHVPAPGADALAPPQRLPDEGALAADTARLHPNIEHVRIPSSGRSPLAELDRYAELFGRPVFNLCNHVWLSQIRSAAAAAGARVLLSGEIGNWTISARPQSLLADYLRERRWLAWGREAWAMARTGQTSARGMLAISFGPWIPDSLWRRLARHSVPSGALTDPVHPRIRDALPGDVSAGRVSDYFEDAAQAIMAMDWGEHRKGIEGGWNLDKRDPTADPRLIDFCLSLPLEMLMHGGKRRPLAAAALADRVAASVLAERRKGYQSPDWHTGLTSDLAGIARLLDEMADDEMASRLIDIARLRALVRNWPRGGWDDIRIISEYRIALLKGLTAGHFILASRR
jgi:asparagine synthase (glutamine-hydrolysing)